MGIPHFSTRDSHKANILLFCCYPRSTMSSSANGVNDGLWHTDRPASNQTQNSTSLGAVVEGNEDLLHFHEVKTRDFARPKDLSPNASPDPKSKLPEPDESTDANKILDTTKSKTAQSEPSTKKTQKLAYTCYYNPLWTDSSASSLTPVLLPPATDCTLWKPETCNNVHSSPNSPQAGYGQNNPSVRIRRSTSHPKLATMISGIALEFPHKPLPITQQSSKNERVESRSSHASAASSAFSQYSTMP